MKQKTRNFLAFMLFTVILSFSCRVAKAEGLKDGNFWYTVNADGKTATITGYEGDAESIVIPNKVAGTYDVTVIGREAFYAECTSYKWKTITISEGIVSIEEDAFALQGEVTTIVLPSTLKSIGDGAFRQCRKLAELTIPEGVESIGEDAFAHQENLITIVLPSTLKSIGDRAFRGCTKLTGLTIPQSVTSIGKGIVGYCDSLTSLTVVGDNNNYESGNGNAIIQTSTKTLVAGCGNTIIPDDVKIIEELSFWGCAKLEKISIPANVEKIEKNAFEDCWNIKEMEVNSANNYYYSEGNTIVKGRDNPKQLILGCKTSVIPDGVTSIEDNAFAERAPESVVIPASVIGIGSGAFSYSGLKTVTFQSGLQTIGEGAFSGCEMKNVELPDSLKTIGDSAFYDCKEFERINLPNGLQTIGNGAFSECTKLSSVTIPNTVTSIGYGAFRGCTGLAGIELPSTITDIGCRAFEGTPWFENKYDRIGLAVVNGVLLSGSKASGKVTIPDTVKVIAEDAFWDNEDVSAITVSDSVASIGDCAFMSCDGLVYVKIPGSVKSIGNDLFDFEEWYGKENMISSVPEVIEVEAGSYAETYMKEKGLKYRTYGETKQDNPTQGGEQETEVPTAPPAQPEQPASSTPQVTVPKVDKVKSLKAVAAKQKLTITWKAVSGAKGYELQYSTKSNFKSAKKVNIKAGKKSYVIKKLKSKKKYYVRVRAYKTYTDKDGKTAKAYSAWVKVNKKTK